MAEHPSSSFGAGLRYNGDDRADRSVSDELAFLTAPVSGDAKDPWQSYSYYFCGMFGYALYLALALTALVGTGPSLHEGFAGVIVQTWFTVAFIVAFVCALLAFWLLSDAFSTKIGSYVFAALSLLFASPAVANVIGLPFAWKMGAWVFAGIGCGSLFLLSAPFLSSLSHRKLIFFLSVSFVCGMLMTVSLLYFPEPVRLVVLCVMVIMSAALHLRTHYLARPHVLVVRAAESKERNKSSLKSSAAAVGNSICIGFVVYCSSLAISFEWARAALGFTAIAAAVVMVVDICRKGIVSSEEAQLRFFLPCVVLGFLPIPFFGEIGCLVGCAILSVVFTMQFITNMGAVAENVYLFKLSPVRYFASSRIGNAIGLLFGYLFGFFAFGPFGQSGLAPISALFIMVAILIVLATFFYKNRYPSLSENGEAAADTKKGRWMKKCDVLAQRSGLTQREHEILRYLAKGHDNEFIQSKLYVSQSTVKSHVYSIYRKIGIHSRKELMTLIEQVDLPKD